jgi:putative ATPase
MPRKREPAQHSSLFSRAREARPLAARMRPVTLHEFVGQAHLLGPGKPLRDAIERGTPGSMIFWGPPGSGKTTLAHLVATSTARIFVPFSAVTEGVPRIREIVSEARSRLESGGEQPSCLSTRFTGSTRRNRIVCCRRLKMAQSH